MAHDRQIKFKENVLLWFEAMEEINKIKIKFLNMKTTMCEMQTALDGMQWTLSQQWRSEIKLMRVN